MSNDRASVAPPGSPLTRRERDALRDVELRARRYAAFTHANLGDRERYRRREEAREELLDALARLDLIRREAA